MPIQSRPTSEELSDSQSIALLKAKWGPSPLSWIPSTTHPYPHAIPTHWPRGTLPALAALAHTTGPTPAARSEAVSLLASIIQERVTKAQARAAAANLARKKQQQAAAANPSAPPRVIIQERVTEPQARSAAAAVATNPSAPPPVSHPAARKPPAKTAANNKKIPGAEPYALVQDIRAAAARLSLHNTDGAHGTRTRTRKGDGNDRAPKRVRDDDDDDDRAPKRVRDDDDDDDDDDTRSRIATVLPAAKRARGEETYGRAEAAAAAGMGAAEKLAARVRNLEALLGKAAGENEGLRREVGALRAENGALRAEKEGREREEMGAEKRAEEEAEKQDVSVEAEVLVLSDD